MTTDTSYENKSSVSELEFDAKTAKRAAWECLEFEILSENTVIVRNASHENPGEHEYRVTVGETKTGSITALHCDCPAFHYGDDDEACKHCVAVAARPIVVGTAVAFTESNTERPHAIADGGQVINADETGYESECVAGESWCPGVPEDAATPAEVTADDLPCWDCWCWWSEHRE